jgi:hypothetical protein
MILCYIAYSDSVSGKNAPTTVVKMNERMETAIWERQPAQAFFPPTNQHKFEPETFRQLQDR